MAALVQTIAVVDKSGKAVSTVSVCCEVSISLLLLTFTEQSKHLVNVFKEAKAAYLERKAEVAASRPLGVEERMHRKALRGATYDEKSHASSRSHSRSHHGQSRPRTHHRHSESSARSESRTIYPASDNRHSLNPRSSYSPTFQPEPLVRRHSAQEDFCDLHPPRLLAVRSMTSPMPSSEPHIDMDLAYGPIPPPLPVVREGAKEREVSGHIQKVKRILEEADCLQYSASAIIATLQKNPDAMAAVALTLAEISNTVTKMAPGALTAMRASSPAVFALLASPQFLIAGGVAVGVTIVAFGGFKIIKKIQAKQAIQVPAMDEMVEIGGDVNRIDTWRRGIAEDQEQSTGTSVEGEFITLQAAALSRLNLNEAKALEVKERESGSTKSSRSRDGNEKASRTGSRDSSKSNSRKKRKEKVKKPSPLRSLFS